MTTTKLIASMLILAALAIGGTVAGCGGDELDVPGDAPECELVELELAANPPRECLYKLPPDTVCADVRIYVDGVNLPEDAYTVVCGAGQVFIQDAICAGHSVALCVR